MRLELLEPGAELLDHLARGGGDLMSWRPTAIVPRRWEPKREDDMTLGQSMPARLRRAAGHSRTGVRPPSHGPALRLHVHSRAACVARFPSGKHLGKAAGNVRK